MSRDRELIASLVVTAGKLQTAHILFRAIGREDICQLLREAALKVGTAIHLHEKGDRDEAVLS